MNGQLAVNGTGGGAGTGGSNYGVLVTNANSTIQTTGSGSLSLNGTGGNGAGSGGGNIGVNVSALGGIQTAGSGNLTLNGTGSTSSGGSNYGVSVASGSIAGAGGAISITGTGDIVIGAGGNITSAATGTAVLLVANGGNFFNSAGDSAISLTGGGRYLVYAADPSISIAGFSSYNKHYDQSYVNGATPAYAGSGNWVFYSVAPVISVTPGAASVTYGDATPTFSASYAGFIGGDATAGTVTGAPIWNVGGATSGAGYLTAGSHEVSYGSGLASSLGYQFADNPASTLELTVNAKALAVTGVAASNKVYDGATAAALTGIAGVSALGADSVSVIGSGSGAFGSKNVGNAISVSVSGFTLAGADAGNYSVQQPTGVTASITPAPLTATVTAPNKVYDGNTSATPTLTITDGLVSGETVTATGTASFNTKDVLTANLVTVNSAALADGLNGGMASNYSLTAGETVAASITQRPLTASVTAPNKTYDGNTGATASLNITSGLVGSETVAASGVASFNTKDVLTANLVTVNSAALADGTNGGLASNYSLAAGEAVAASITQRPLTASVTAPDKVYNGNTTATPTLAITSGLVSGETVTATGTATFNTKDVLTANLVTVNSAALADGLNGGLASNYSLTAGETVAASIIPAKLAVTGITANNKVYDSSLAATLTGVATVAAIGADAVTVVGTGHGEFVSGSVGTGKAVVVTGFGLGGTDAANYAVQQPSGLTASINAPTVALPVILPAPAPLTTADAAGVLPLLNAVTPEAASAGDTAAAVAVAVAAAPTTILPSDVESTPSDGPALDPVSVGDREAVPPVRTVPLLSALPAKWVGGIAVMGCGVRLPENQLCADGSTK